LSLGTAASIFFVAMASFSSSFLNNESRVMVCCFFYDITK
jgi:hypothetical protein